MRIIALLLLLCTLAGCSLAPDEYLSVTPHMGSSSQSAETDAVPAENYRQLKRAILGFVSAGQTEGIIRVTNYSGNVEEDLTLAAYEVAKLDPLGAYAVDYMTHDCILIVNYYEIRIRITFRRTAREIASIEPVSSQVQLRQRLEKAVDQQESSLVLRMPNFRDPDVEAMVLNYCARNPGTVMETPQVSMSVYPDSGAARILEIDLLYTETPETLRAKAQAVRRSIAAAAEYIRYRETDRDKAELLFTYMMERFTYTEGHTPTPVYDALCGGVADPAGLAQAWQLICDQAGVECFAVTGLRNGEAYTWNIVSYDGQYRHVDLARCVLEDGVLRFRTDLEMMEYYWNQTEFPACVSIIEIPTTQTETPAEPTQNP